MPQLNDTVAKVHQARASAYRTFKAKWEQMQENSDFIRLLQYSQKQLNKMDEQKRVPYVLDFLNRAMNTFQGIQRDRRTEIFYYGVEPGDEVKCEVLNAVKDHILQTNSFIYKESDVFQDGLIQKIGAVEFEWSREKNKLGTLNILVIPPRQLMWDLNGNEFDKSDCTWMSRHRLFGKRELINRFPKRKEEIEKMAFDDSDMFGDLNLSRDYRDSILDLGLGAIALIEFYERKYETRWFVQDEASGQIDDLYYDSEKDAARAIREKNEKRAAVFSGQGILPPENTLRTFEDKFPVILKSETCGELTFSEEQPLKEPFYPISFYHPFWVDRDWYSPIDIVKDGQRYFNKMFSLADHWIGVSSKGLILTDSKNTDEVKRVKDAFATTGGVVTVEDVENYREIKPNGPAPQLFSLIDLAYSQISDNSGGRNFQGQKETASESGVAVRQRIEQGGLAGFIIYDNLRRWKMDVGTKIAWYLTNRMTYPSVVRIEGEELVQEIMQKFQAVNQTRWFRTNPLRPGIGYVEVNTEGQNTLEGIQVDTIVDEARWSVSKNQSILQEISIAMQSNPNLASTFPPEAMIHFMNLPFSIKQQAIQRMKMLEDRQAQLEQMKAQKPPSVSATLADAQTLPAQAFAEFMLKYFEIQIDPSQVQNPEVMKNQMELVKTVMGMKMKGEEHQMNLAAKQRELELKSVEQEQNLLHNQLAGEQKLSFAERQQTIKERDNGASR